MAHAFSCESLTQIYVKCEGDKELIQEVLFDAVVTAPLEAYWTSLVLNKSEYVTHSTQQLLDNR